jgi:hypothetical protein
MQYLIAGSLRHLLLRGTSRVRNHAFDLAAKAFFIKLERGLTLAIEFQIWI